MLLFLLTFGYVWRETGLVKSQAASVSFVLVALIAVLGYESLFAFLNDIAPQIFHKLVETESQTTMTRTMGPIINLQIFAQKPLFGWGFTGAATQFAKHLGFRIVAQTATSTQLLSAIGICGSVYTLAFVYPLFAKKSAKVLYFVDKAILAICMIAIVNKEPHVFFLTTWMLMFYFFEFCRKRHSAHIAEREITDFDEKRSC